MRAPVAIVYHEEMLQHQPPGLEPEMRDYHARQLRARLGELVASGLWRHPERPERLSSLVERAREFDDGSMLWLSPERADEPTVRRAHTGGHMERLDKLRGRKRMLSIDSTAVSPESVDAAFRAAGAACTAVDAVCDGRASSAFALVRPPGHHANAAHYQGFCLVNNVAVAARHAMVVHGLERVLIVDWDVHHGNGTASIFTDDPDVLFFDIHRGAPYYPGTGALDDVGRGRARGTNLNVPLPAATSDLAVLEAFDRILIPAARRFKPDLVLVSAGFDGTREHLACKFSTALYAHLTERMRRLADQLCAGRLAMVLEGGYHLEPMREGLVQCLRTLGTPGGELPPLQRSRIGLPAVREAAEFLTGRSALLHD